ncbi:MAG: LCP family protein [Oscillospiraceae bacterium]|nr:LCP family protein [Oscillospiraceae bacterium]
MNKFDEYNADLPRPRQTSQNNNSEMQFENAMPELRRANKKTEQNFSDTVKLQSVGSEYQEFENTDEEYEEDFGYGAYEEYDKADWRQNQINMNKTVSKKNQKSQKNYAQNRQAVKKSNQTNKPSKKKKSHGGGFLQRLVRKIAVFIAVIFAIYSAIALLLISKLEKIPKGERLVTSGTLQAGYVQNILLIGTDARDITTERGRSDTILLLSLNSRTQKIYLTSFMRDAYVEIPNYGNHKLNAAYSFGGGELLMDTLEKNYNISIDDYLCVSFMGFAGIIDALGGVEMMFLMPRQML